MPVTLLTFVAMTAIQLATLFAMAPSRLIGDESEYAFGAPHVSGQSLWIRVPLQGWLVRLFGRAIRLPDAGGGRLFSGCCAIAAATLATGYVEQTQGIWPALITAAILLLSVERAVLAIHLWPDSFLSLLILLFALLLQNLTPALAPWLAVVAVVAFAVRVDNAALFPIAIVAPFAGLLDQSLASALIPVAITAIGIGALCLRSRILFDSWLPDTTFGFNVAVARRDIGQPGATTDRLMSETIRERRGDTPRAPQDGPILPRAIAAFLIRLKTVLGAETFISQQLIARGAVSYRRSRLLTGPSPLAVLLRHAFSAALALLLVTAAQAPGRLLIVFGVFVFIYSFVQTRSRYRVALIPLQAVIVGTALPEAIGTFASGGGISPLSIGLLLALGTLLWFVPARREI